MSQRPYTVADAFLDILKHFEVSHIFGYPGGAILPFYDALPYHPEIKHILTRHEQGAAFMAGGWARSTKKIGVCCATSGPGATNLVTGIADANLDSIPMLCITGQVPFNMMGNDMFQEVDVVGVTMGITKHNYLLDDPLKTAQVVAEAITVALSGRPGPVLIDVPKNIMASEHPREFEIPKITYTKTPKHIYPQGVDVEVCASILQTLQQAKKPIMLIGQGVKHADAEKQLTQFIDALGIPMVHTILAKGAVSPDNPNNLGWLGMHGYYHSNMAIHEADVIFNIGSRFDDRIVGRYDVFGKNATIIHVDIDASELNKIVEVDYAIHADAKDIFEALLEQPLNQLDISPWHAQIQQWKQEKPYIDETPEHFSMRNCIKDMNAYIEADPEQFIVVADVGQHQMWASSGCFCNDTTKWLCSGGAGTMGFALPTAIGAAFAHPDKTILCISGDGGFQMNLQELSVIKDYNLNIKVMVLNNSFLGMVRQWQELFYDHNYSSVAITSPDYVKLADAYGLPATLVTDQESLVIAHEGQMATEGGHLIEYQVVKEDNVMPMVPAGKHLGETIA
jgi:acetolactate synthase-1/2/3 large subunit